MRECTKSCVAMMTKDSSDYRSAIRCRIMIGMPSSLISGNRRFAQFAGMSLRCEQRCPLFQTQSIAAFYLICLAIKRIRCIEGPIKSPVFFRVVLSSLILLSADAFSIRGVMTPIIFFIVFLISDPFFTATILATRTSAVLGVLVKIIEWFNLPACGTRTNWRSHHA